MAEEKGRSASRSPHRDVASTPSPIGKGKGAGAVSPETEAVLAKIHASQEASTVAGVEAQCVVRSNDKTSWQLWHVGWFGVLLSFHITMDDGFVGPPQSVTSRPT